MTSYPGDGDLKGHLGNGLGHVIGEPREQVQGRPGRRRSRNGKDDADGRVGDGDLAGRR